MVEQTRCPDGGFDSITTPTGILTNYQSACQRLPRLSNADSNRATLIAKLAGFDILSRHVAAAKI
jgi:hypothetical protein